MRSFVGIPQTPVAADIHEECGKMERSATGIA